MPHISDYPTLTAAAALLVADSGIPPWFPEASRAYTSLLALEQSEGQDFQTAEQELAALTQDQLEEAVIGEAGAVALSDLTHLLLEWLFERLAEV